jgi:hypothetical protein
MKTHFIGKDAKGATIIISTGENDINKLDEILEPHKKDGFRLKQISPARNYFRTLFRALIGR